MYNRIIRRKYKLKRCNKCRALLKVFKERNYDNCGITCCGEILENIKPKSVDASFEKHVPEYQIDGENINVRVNHVMDEDHYIEWISYVYDKNEQIVYFAPGDEPIATFKYVKGATIYSYCNKHSLWVKEVE